ncbi:MAG: hypothetical protein H0T87_04390 [Gammaproteobacteria bacterium]|nr:hypothetical protein [Gammaproteobacteria bacterium]
MVVGACTLEKRDTATKIRSDLAVIFGSGVRPERVIYFCESDIPVAKRHQLQERCQSDHGANLNLHDGTAIADPDTFWIAEQYLGVPTDLFPSDVGGDDFQKRRTRWLDERTKRIEAKLDGIAKDEKAEAAKRRWEYIKSHDIRQVALFFVLKSEIGFDWFREVLNETRLTFGREHRGPNLRSLLDESGRANSEKSADDADSVKSSFWEGYKHAAGYWVRRTSRAPRKFSVVAGFDVTDPWSSLGVQNVTKLADLATLTEIGIQYRRELTFPAWKSL